ncbi:TPA: hypothetical protein NO894_001168 [Klebsiella quasipneumoniae subsp. similipneumoniae]|nr:hypothetical protein [Klebsiella quasipneumoniae subsp. similipneumoniae]
MVILNRGKITTRLYSENGCVYAASEFIIDKVRSLKITQFCPLNTPVPRNFIRGAAQSSFSHKRGLYRFILQKNIDSMMANPGFRYE